MSLLIPSGQLSRTIVTVRCDTPHSAPQIECSLDEQRASTTTSSTPSFNPNAPNSMLLDVNPSRLDAPCLSSSSRNLSHSDLSVERGVDHRGHFVRLSFQPSPPSTPSNYDNPLARSNLNGAPRVGQETNAHDFTPQHALLHQQFSIPSQATSPALAGSTGSGFSSLIVRPFVRQAALPHRLTGLD